MFLLQAVVSEQQAKIIVENFLRGGSVKELARVYWEGQACNRISLAHEKARVKVCQNFEGQPPKDG